MKTILLTFLFLATLTVNAQPPSIQWQKSLGGSGNEQAYSIFQTTDGGYITAGSTTSSDNDVTGLHGSQDCWVIKLNSSGQLQWQKTYGGSKDEAINNMVQTSDGGYVFAASSQSSDMDATINKGGYDYWVVKLDAAGNIQWQKSFGGSKNDVPNAIQQTTDGGYIVGGYALSSDGDVTGNHGTYDYWVLKLDGSGNIQWKKAFGGSLNDDILSVTLTEDNGYILAGYSNSTNGDVTGNHGDYDYWLVKLDNTGTAQWKKTYGGSGQDLLQHIYPTPDGGFLMSGKSFSNNYDVTGNHGSGDAWVIKIDNAGTIQWQKALGGTGEEVGLKTCQAVDGGYILTAFTKSNNGDVSGSKGMGDVWLTKLDNSGNLVWQKTYGGSNDDVQLAIQTTTDGGYIMAGYTLSSDQDVSVNYGGKDIWVVKLAPVLSLLPTKITAISAVRSGESNIVSWSTATEDEGDYFILQRSSDGKQFENITAIQAKGGESSYRYADGNKDNSTYYYRLKIVLKSGNQSFSSIVKVYGNTITNTMVNIYPNPAKNSLYINTSSSLTQNTNIQILDMAGKLLQTATATGNQAIVDVSKLPAGIYTLLLYNANVRSVQRFVVER